MKRLKEVVDKQRDEIRAKDRELGLKNEDVEAVSDQLQSEPTFLLHGALGAGPERWLSSKSICCSSQSRAQLPAPTGQVVTVRNCSLRSSDTFSWPSRALDTCGAQIYT